MLKKCTFWGLLSMGMLLFLLAGCTKGNNAGTAAETEGSGTVERTPPPTQTEPATTEITPPSAPETAAPPTNQEAIPEAVESTDAVTTTEEPVSTTETETAAAEEPVPTTATETETAAADEPEPAPVTEPAPAAETTVPTTESDTSNNAPVTETTETTTTATTTDSTESTTTATTETAPASDTRPPSTTPSSNDTESESAPSSDMPSAPSLKIALKYADEFAANKVIALTIQLTNTLDKDLTAFNGMVHILDVNGKLIEALDLQAHDIKNNTSGYQLAQGASKRWGVSIAQDRYPVLYETLKTASLSDLNAQFLLAEPSTE